MDELHPYKNVNKANAIWLCSQCYFIKCCEDEDDQRCVARCVWKFFDTTKSNILVLHVLSNVTLYWFRHDNLEFDIN